MRLTTIIGGLALIISLFFGFDYFLVVIAAIIFYKLTVGRIK